MNTQLPLTDDAIRAAIARRATAAGERDLRERVLAAAAVAPQRRPWHVRSNGISLPQRRTAVTLATAALLLLAATVGVALVGSLADDTAPDSLGRLAYISDADVYVAGPLGESPQRVWDLPPGSQSGDDSLTWLDPESVLLYAGSPVGRLVPDGIYVLNVRTGAYRLVTPEAFLALSPDRRVVAVRMFDESPTPRVFVRLVDVATGSVNGEIAGLIAGEPALWSPDGRFILSSNNDTIDRVDVATGERTILARDLCCGLSSHWPTWSPDGSRVVYVNYHEPTHGFGVTPECSFRCGTVWTVPASGGAPARLTPEAGSELRPAYSPDGRWIAYIEESSWRLTVIAPDGSAPSVLGPDWLRDGSAGLGSVGPRFSWDQDSRGITYLSPVGTMWHVTLDGVATRIEAPTVSEFARLVLP